jgi:protoporphyrinogen oxidase
MSLKTAIIGGGISGLASALRIAQRGHRVTLFEGEDVLGGLGTTFPWRGYDLERFYHCVLPQDVELVALIRELGLEGELLWKRTHMGFMYQRRIHAMDGPLDLLRFSPLTITERLRLGLMGLRTRMHGMDPALDGVAVGDWIRAQVGDRVFQILWRPLLEAKIGDQYPGIPALWLSSRMSREKTSAPETKGCLTGGYRTLIDAFERHLRARGVQIRLRTRVRALEARGETLALRLEDDALEPYDAVVVTSPLPQFQRMTEGLHLPPALARLQVDYQGVLSSIVLTDRPLTSYYWMPIVDSGATAQGLIAMSNLVPLERAGGHHVNYLMNYTHRSGALWAESDDAIRARHHADLTSLFPAARGHIVDHVLFRAPFVEPIWTLNYSRLRPPTSVIPGRLYLACTAQVYPKINSWNSCCEVVSRMMDEFDAETAPAAAPAAERHATA